MEAGQKQAARKSRKKSTKQSSVASDVKSIVLEVSLTIQDISDYKNRLAAFLDSNEEVCVDCSKVENIDSAGLQLLIAFQNEMNSRGNKVKLLCSDVVHNIATMMGLSKQLEISI
jgi:ABC-type transporter Mla MlaB component